MCLPAVYVCKLADGEQPLFLRLVAGPDTDTLSFVLREQQTGEVMVTLHLHHPDNCTLQTPKMCCVNKVCFAFLLFPVGRVLHPRAAQLPADPRQGGGRAEGGGDSPLRGLPPETAGGAAGGQRALLKD